MFQLQQERIRVGSKPFLVELLSDRASNSFAVGEYTTVYSLYYIHLSHPLVGDFFYYPDYYIYIPLIYECRGDSQRRPKMSKKLDALKRIPH